MTNIDEYDYLFKIVLVGDSAVGKTNVLTKYTHNSFSADSKSTIGVEFSTKTITVENERIKIQVWDTAGQERYRAICAAYYRNALAVIVVYDITRYNTFENISEWLREIRNYVQDNTVIAIVGNKCDLQHMRAVSAEKAKELATENNLTFYEVSALTGSGIDDMFRQISGDIYVNIKQMNEPFVPPVTFPPPVQSTPSPQQDKKCC